MEWDIRQAIGHPVTTSIKDKEELFFFFCLQKMMPAEANKRFSTSSHSICNRVYELEQLSGKSEHLAVQDATLTVQGYKQKLNSAIHFPFCICISSGALEFKQY